MSLPAVGAPRVPHNEGTEKPVFQRSLPKFCHFLQKRLEVLPTLTYTHTPTHIYKATARCGSKFSTSLASCQMHYTIFA